MRGIVHTSRASVGIDYSSARRVPVRAWITYQLARVVRVWVWALAVSLWLPWPQPRAERAWGEAGSLAILALAMALVQALGLPELEPAP